MRRIFQAIDWGPTLGHDLGCFVSPTRLIALRIKAKLLVFLIACVCCLNPKPALAHTLFSSVEGCRQEVIEVVSGIHVAVGYSLANSTLIEGESGAIVVDTTEGTDAAQRVLTAFRSITPKPIKAIIYTHSHRDHISGATVFAGDGEIDIYARANFPSEALKLKELQRIYDTRVYWQHGFNLTPEEHSASGLDPCEQNFDTAKVGFLPPNHTVDQDRLALEIAGVKLELVAAPGETDDQLYVWLPDQKVLLCGDNYFDAFPNAYAIKGTYRDIHQWTNSLELMLDQQPEYLIPGHLLPILGGDRVEQVLRDYRDALRSILDQTLTGINQGLTPEQLVARVALSPDLANQSYLQNVYGTVPWTVRGIYAQYLGWFDGNPTNLFPLSPRTEAQKIAQIAGGPENLLAAAIAALAAQDYQWTLQLTDYLIHFPFHAQQARHIKAEALIALARMETNINAEHYYLSAAKTLRQ